MVSFDLTTDDEGSKVVIGGARDLSSIQWHSTTAKTSSYWTLGLDKVKFGDFEFELEAKEAFIDSGSSYILIPPFEYEQLTSRLS